MKVLSVNIATPTSIDYKGKSIKTGIFKEPVNGAIPVTAENLAGDKQADLKNHGGEHKAVYAYSSDHYLYWSDVLKKPLIKPGAFGENLTISGLDESKLNIGDQLEVGSCLLEVTQPRVPCFKLGIAFNDKNMPRLFVASNRTGAYLRVIKEGTIEAGDDVVVSKKNPFNISVQEIFRACFDRDYTESVSLMENAIKIPELSGEWKAFLSTKLSRVKTG